MYDNTAWKPLLLLPVIGLCILFERGIFNQLVKIMGVLFIPVLVILSVFALVKFIQWETPEPYQKPHASARKIGVINLTGDAEIVQRHMNELTNPATFVHEGHKRWRVEMPNIKTAEMTYDICDAINAASDKLPETREEYNA